MLFKARIGDPEPEVTVECLSALLAADPDWSVPFVAAFLAPDLDEVAEGSALALGESRRPADRAALKAHWPDTGSDSLPGVLQFAIAITRLPGTIDFPVNVVADEGNEVASSALSALAVHRQNPAVRERIVAVAARRRPAVRKPFDNKFRAED